MSACERKAPAPAAMPAADQPAPQAPPTFRVRFETSRGPFTVEVRRAWAPRGADRFHQLVQSGYYDNNRFFRVVPGFVVQFGMHADPAVNAAWDKLPIQDDSVAQSNKRGSITFATSGPDTRTTQLFINLVDNPQLDGMGFSPFGTVVEGMGVVDSIYAGYGESPQQDQIAARGNAYLEQDFPQLDFIRTARLEQTAPPDSVAGRERTK
jgi:peptidyl-prolyl cis-trans isomerase A (cyclophilin A)